MNAIILSAVWGIVMMFSGVFLKSKTAIRNLGIVGLTLLLVGNYADWMGHHLLVIDVHKMLFFQDFRRRAASHFRRRRRVVVGVPNS